MKYIVYFFEVIQFASTVEANDPSKALKKHAPELDNATGYIPQGYPYYVVVDENGNETESK